MSRFICIVHDHILFLKVPEGHYSNPTVRQLNLFQTSDLSQKDNVSIPSKSPLNSVLKTCIMPQYEQLKTSSIKCTNCFPPPETLGYRGQPVLIQEGWSCATTIQFCALQFLSNLHINTSDCLSLAHMWADFFAVKTSTKSLVVSL